MTAVDLEARRYSSGEVVTMTEISYRQLDYWTRADLFSDVSDPTPGSGVRRTYSRRDVELAYGLRILVDAGVGMAALSRAIRHGRLESMLREISRSAALVLDAMER